MSLADDYKVLERRYLAARQQIEKLQSNVRILKSSNDDLADRAEGLQKDAKEYKKAFEEIFIHRVGAAWDNIPPSERDGMGIKEKLEFYKPAFASKEIAIFETVLPKITQPFPLLVHFSPHFSASFCTRVVCLRFVG